MYKDWAGPYRLSIIDHMECYPSDAGVLAHCVKMSGNTLVMIPLIMLHLRSCMSELRSPLTRKGRAYSNDAV